MNYEEIIYEKDGGKARIILNQPEKLNGISPEMQEEISNALWTADSDPDVHVVILKGNGRSFSAGYDMKPKNPEQFARVAFDADTWRLEKWQRLRMAIFDMHRPVIAQVHGYCIAGGSDLALLCDIIIAADDAKFGFPPVRAMGAPPSHMWTYHVGPQWTKRILLTGDFISGRDAERIGLVLRSYPIEELESQVEGLADRMTLIDRDLLAVNKRMTNLALELMGARTAQRLGAEFDTRGHQVQPADEFRSVSREQGLRAALQWRDAKFGDSLNAPAQVRRD